jgi:hypothetical protein
MNKIVHYIGLDVHKDSIAVAIAPQDCTEVRRYNWRAGAGRRAFFRRATFARHWCSSPLSV